jgi:putative transposase
VPRVLVTVKLASYRPAHRVVMPSVQHRQSTYLNNQAEYSHQPTRQRAGDETVHLARACATVPVRVQPHLATLRPRRHVLSATGRRDEMADRFTVWNQITGVTTTAA